MQKDVPKRLPVSRMMYQKGDPYLERRNREVDQYQEKMYQQKGYAYLE